MVLARQYLVAACAALWLAPSPAAAAECGGAGQRPCNIVQDLLRFAKIGACESDLVYIPLAACIEPVDEDVADQKARELAELTSEIFRAFEELTLEDPALLAALIIATEQGDIRTVERIMRQSTFLDEVLALMRGLGMQSVTLGVGGAGSLVIGGGGEGGVALDTAMEAIPLSYSTAFWSVGYQVGLGADLVIGGWLPINACIDGETTGRSVQIDVGPGIGTALWYDGADFVGFSVPVGLTGVGVGVAHVMADTDVHRANCPPGGVWPVVVPPDPPQPPTPPEPPAPETIIVAAGDSLWALSEKHLGDAERYPTLFEANAPPLTHPDLIYPGQELVLPDD